MSCDLIGTLVPDSWYYELSKSLRTTLISKYRVTLRVYPSY